MKRIGIIGCGNMGSMIADKLCSKAGNEDWEIRVSNRSLENSAWLRTKYPNLQTSDDNSEIAANCQILFLCVSPEDVRPILHEIDLMLKMYRPHLVSILACVSLLDLERAYAGPVSRMMPTLTCWVDEGVTLLCHNDFTSQEKAAVLQQCLHGLGEIKVLDEDEFERMTKLTSSGPAIFAAILNTMAKLGIQGSKLPVAEVEHMLVKTMLGTARLLGSGMAKAEEVVGKVSTTKGITMEGIAVLLDAMPEMFSEAFERMERKKELILEDLKASSSMNNYNPS